MIRALNPSTYIGTSTRTLGDRKTIPSPQVHSLVGKFDAVNLYDWLREFIRGTDAQGLFGNMGLWISTTSVRGFFCHPLRAVDRLNIARSPLSSSYRCAGLQSCRPGTVAFLVLLGSWIDETTTLQHPIK